eukprot:6511424-Karenia_brevis.AAC.1
MGSSLTLTLGNLLHPCLYSSPNQLLGFITCTGSAGPSWIWVWGRPPFNHTGMWLITLITLLSTGRAPPPPLHTTWV